MRNPTGIVDDLVIVKSVNLPVSARKAFEQFTLSANLEAWLCERARVEPRCGGGYELFWDGSDPENDSTIGCRITAFQEDSILAFQWRSPRQFKAWANAADPLTHVVVAFHEAAHGCRVTLIHSGWRSTREWLEAAEWQSRAWDHAFRALAGRMMGLDLH